MALDKKKVLKVIVESAKQYEEKLNKKAFLIIYKTPEKIEYTEVCFRSWHFLHLTGVKSSLTAQQFYERCLAQRLSENDIMLDKQGKVAQKIKVLPFLSELLYHNCMIGDFINSGIMIRADYFVGDTKLVLSVGFRREARSDIPVTLYSGDIRNLTNPTNKVLAIFSRSMKEKTYSKKNYMNLKTVFEDWNIPRELFDDKLLIELEHNQPKNYETA